MAKVRLHEASKRYNIGNKELAQLLGKLGYEVKAHPFTALDPEMLQAAEAHFNKTKAGGKADKTVTEPKPESKGASPKTPAKSAKRKTESASKPAPKTDSKPSDKTRGAVATSKKKAAPKPSKSEDAEEVEVNKQITIIKTAPAKKEVAAPKKKKVSKTKSKRASFSKKVQAEMREAERQSEAVLDRSGKTQRKEEQEEVLESITVPQDVTVSQLAKYIDTDAVAIIKKLFSLGVVASLNQRLESEHVQLIGQEFGKDISFTDDVFDFKETPDSEEDLKPRPPVVTIMGHVDHGKTSLLDCIRKAHVADKEVGGITQHIGAYQVKTKNGVITFIDTPGHEAFTAMRAQGALVTDIAILVVAADDGVQQQTVEAIHHAQAAGVPIIVAINKMDKPEANLDRAKQQLMPYNLVADDWGGNVTMVPVSAQTGTGIEDLLEMILLQSEMMDLKANPDKPGYGTIIEAKLDRNMGPMGSVLITAGKISNGDHIICGNTYGRVKAMVTETGARIKEAGPAYPVAILGLNEVPTVGDKLAVVESAKFARHVGGLRMIKAREERLSRDNKLKLVDFFKHISEGQVKDLNIIIKADVQGSAGALKDALERLTTDTVKVNVLHAGVGGITEADVSLASASNAIIVGFHVRPMTGVDEAAKAEDVEIKIFKIIYDAIDAVKLALIGMYDPEYEEESLGRAEVRKVYKVTGAGTICGSYVVSGTISRNAKVRVIRDGIEVFEGKIGSLKRFKDDIREVHSGYECGIGIENYNDIKEGDILEAFLLKRLEVVL